MSSQIFKNPIPSQLLIKLLNDIAIKTDKCYVLNNNAFKKINYLRPSFVFTKLKISSLSCAYNKNPALASKI